MIKNSIITIKNVLFSIVCLMLLSCRGEVIATDADLSNFGWALYEDGQITVVNLSKKRVKFKLNIAYQDVNSWPNVHRYKYPLRSA